MRNFSVTIGIVAPAERVWQILTDVERWPEWTPSMRRIQLLDGAPLALGSRVLVEQPKLPPATWTVTGWEPPERFVWVSKSPGVTTVATHSLTSTPERCTLALHIQFNGFLGGLAGMLYGSLTQNYIGIEAKSLKTRSENSGAASG